MEAQNSSLSKSAVRQFTEYSKQVKDIEKYSDAPKCDSNPFLPMLEEVIEMKSRKVGSTKGMANLTVLNDDTGEVEAGFSNKAFYGKTYVDDDKFIKIYQHHLKEMFALGGGAIKVFGYFLHEMQGVDGMNKDMVYFNVQDCMDFCTYRTHGQVYKGLTELIKNLFISIAPRTNFFYINPKYAFNGNRILVFQEFIREDGLTRANEQKQLGDGAED